MALRVVRYVRKRRKPVVARVQLKDNQSISISHSKRKGI